MIIKRLILKELDEAIDVRDMEKTDRLMNVLSSESESIAAEDVKTFSKRIAKICESEKHLN